MRLGMRWRDRGVWACALTLGVGLAGCGGRGSAQGSASVDSEESVGTSTVTSSVDTTTSFDDDSSDVDASEADGNSGTTTCGGNVEERCFVPIDTNISACGVLCDILDDDCDEGQKCTAAACEPGLSTPDQNVCRDIMGDAAPGEACTATDPYFGTDTCDASGQCVGVDPDTLQGTCLETCIREGAALVCSEPGHTCQIGYDGVLPLCLQDCDPRLAPSCDTGWSCVAFAGFGCIPNEELNPNAGEYGDSCANFTDCMLGNACVAAARFVAGACAGTSCCAPYCTLPGDGSCPDAAAGAMCQPTQYADEPMHPLADLGVCGL